MLPETQVEPRGTDGSVTPDPRPTVRDPVTRTAAPPITPVMNRPDVSWSRTPPSRRRRASFPLAFAGFVALSVLAAPPAGLAAEPDGPALSDDRTLTSLVVEALENRPEVSQARALIAAEGERVPQAGALADPSLTFGIQNDSFTKIQIG